MFRKNTFSHSLRFFQCFFVALTLVLITLTHTHSYANSKYASLVIDGETGVVLHQDNAGKKRHPASLTKMMTLYLTFQALETGKLHMGEYVSVSSRAAGQPPSKIRLRRGDRIKIRDAILAAIVKSANDSTVVLAEAVAGSEWQFALMMNRMARKLGMNNTHFRNSSGLHDRKQVTTAYDMARLAVALKRDYPQYYHLFKRSKFFYKGRTYTSHNKVTRNYRGADGLKTGYIRAAGFNLVTSAKRNGDNIIGVVMGGRSSKTRDRHMVKLLDRGFYKMAKGRTGKERIYTGLTPKPKLKKTSYSTFAGIPEPKISTKHSASQRTKVARNAKASDASDFLVIRSATINRVRVGNRLIPVPLLRANADDLQTASLRK